MPEKDSFKKLVDKQRRKINPEPSADIPHMPKSRPPATPECAERIEVFKALFPSSMPFAVSFIIFTGVVFCIIFMLIFKKWFMFGIIASALITLWFAGCLTAAVFARMRFGIFMKWRQRLPFKLIGWNELVDHNALGWPLCWRRGSLRIMLKMIKRDDSWDEALNAVLAEFIRKSGKAFYSAENPANDFRKPWSIKSGFMCSGSINTKIAVELYELIKGNLGILSRRGDFIDSILIECEDLYFQVNPHISKMN